MKRYILSAVLGITTLTAFGQGGIVFNNGPSGGPYNPIVWFGGQGVKSTDGVIVTLWYGEGALNEAQLVAGPVVEWNVGFESLGYYGYYTVNATLPTWNPGDTFTFQLRATGNSIYGPLSNFGPYTTSIPWTESSNILYVGGNPPGVPGISQNSIGIAIVPEPTTASLAALGLSGLWFFRHGRKMIRERRS